MQKVDTVPGAATSVGTHTLPAHSRMRPDHTHHPEGVGRVGTFAVEPHIPDDHKSGYSGARPSLDFLDSAHTHGLQGSLARARGSWIYLRVFHTRQI